MAECCAMPATSSIEREERWRGERGRESWEDEAEDEMESDVTVMMRAILPFIRGGATTVDV